MCALLSQWLSSAEPGELRDYASRLCSLFDVQFTSSRTARDAPARGSLVEPLTPREREVLQLICAGHSNQVIAEKLVVTVATVKKHAGNILGKLGVSSRAQAIVKARQLGLFGGGD